MSTLTISAAEKAGLEALAKLQQQPPPQPVPALAPTDPAAGKDDPAQNKPTLEQEEKERLSKMALNLRKELEGLLGELPHEAARKTIEEQLKNAVPKTYHTREQLLAMQADLELTCNMVGRLTKALRPQEVKKKDLLPETKPAPAPSLGTRLLRWWKPALIVTAIIVPTIFAILLIAGVRFGSQGSSVGTPPKDPTKTKFNL